MYIYRRETTELAQAAHTTLWCNTDKCGHRRGLTSHVTLAKHMHNLLATRHHTALLGL